MTWKSHIAIATATALPFNTLYVPFAILGSTAPDWSEWILKFFGITVQHRGATHYLIIPLIIIAVGIGFALPPVVWFGIGYLTHWFADSLTISGVPLSPFDSHKIHFFNGRLRTGEPMEYFISFGLLLASLMLVKPNIDLITNQDKYKFNPYYINYGKLHDDKIIDNKTMLENRFKLF